MQDGGTRNGWSLEEVAPHAVQCHYGAAAACVAQAPDGAKWPMTGRWGCFVKGARGRPAALLEPRRFDQRSINVSVSCLYQYSAERGSSS